MQKYFFLVVSLCFFQGGYSQKIDDSFYQLVSASSQQCIDIPRASNKNGERLFTWRKTVCQFNQLWKFEQVDAYYIIRSKYNNKVIAKNNNIVEQQDYKNSEQQHWQIKKSGDYIFIISNENGLALTVSGQSEIVLEEFDRRESQKWYLNPSRLDYVEGGFNQVLTPEEMKADVEYFFDKLVEIHVNPYAFVSKDSLEQRKELLLKELKQPLKRYEFNRIISSLNGMFDGHTNIQDYDFSYFQTYVNNYGRIIPFKFKYTPQNLYLNTEIDTLKHLEILSINNIPFSKISSEIEKRENLELRKMRNTSIQSNLYGLMFGLFDIQSPYNLIVLDTLTNEIKKVELFGLPKFQLSFAKRTNIELYSSRIYPEESIAIIEYNNCYSKNRSKFNRYIDSVFMVINKSGIKHLFIDISRNGGGSTSTNNVFYRNINHTPKNWVETYTKKISNESKLHVFGLSLSFSSKPFEERMAEYNAKIKAGNLGSWASEISSLENGDFFHKDIIFCQDEVSNGYSNNLYIIQSELTFSAAVDMSAWFRYSDVGLLVGSETGGTTEVYIEGINFYLPNSNIFFRVSDNYSSYPNGSLDQGIIPDVDLGPDFYKDKYELEDLKHFLNLINASY